MSISRRALPPLNALRAFEVAGNTLNFRIAADQLGVTQGAVAQHVRTLEDHLGFALFDRLPRGLALTAQGTNYLSELSRAFDTLCTATADLRGTKRPPTGRVSLGVTPTIAARLILPRLAALQAALPGVELRILANEPEEDGGTFAGDIVIRPGHGAAAPGQEIRPLFPERLIAVASPSLIGTRLLPVSLAVLQTLPKIETQHTPWAAFLGGVNPACDLTVNQTVLALEAAMAGCGLALTCRAFAEDALASGRLVQVTDLTLATARTFRLIRPAEPGDNPAVQAVWEWCATSLVPPQAPRRRERRV